jgi:hypothetical protein
VFNRIPYSLKSSLTARELAKADFCSLKLVQNAYISRKLVFYITASFRFSLHIYLQFRSLQMLNNTKFDRKVLQEKVAANLSFSRT